MSEKTRKRTKSRSSSKRPTTNSWTNLSPGDHVRVSSHNGNGYEATIVYVGSDDAGLYVRLPDGRLARLLPSRCDWKTLQRLGARDIVARGDEIIVAMRGFERRGRVRGQGEDRLVVGDGTDAASKDEFSVALKDAPERKLRLLYKTKSLRRGDEFVVRSRSGREIRGRVREVDEQRVVASVRSPKPGTVAIRVDHLDLETLFVLIPVLGASPSWAD